MVVSLCLDLDFWGVFAEMWFFYLGLWVLVLGWWCGWGLVVEIGFVGRSALQKSPCWY